MKEVMQVIRHHDCKPEICQNRLLELANKKVLNQCVDLTLLLQQSSECRECAKHSKDTIKQSVADELNTLFCEKYIEILLMKKQNA